MRYDVVIPVANKDAHRVHSCVESLKFLKPKPDNVYVIIQDISMVSDLSAKIISEDDCFKFNRRGSVHGWVFQQFLKLFQKVTENDTYLCVDSDTIFLKRMDVFGLFGELLFWKTHFDNRGDELYFEFMKRAIGQKRIVSHSAMCHFMMMNREVTGKILDKFDSLHPGTEGSKESRFYDWALDNTDVNGNCAMSEWEMYCNFVLENYPRMYSWKTVHMVDWPVYGPVSIDVVLDKVNRYGVGPDAMTVHSRPG